ncbi:MAG: hypothetical protein ACRC2K_11670 [Clostridium sp.]
MKLSIEFDKDISRYSCDSCSRCASEIGTSYCNPKYRGCCFYFPKFNLVDIQRMLQDEEGEKTLNKILSHKGTIINKYHLHAIGSFDELSYNEFMKTYEEKDNSLEDKTLYFKSCPFVVDGVGCTIPPRFRTPVCNYFLCKEIKTKAKNQDLIKAYEKEASSFYKWYDYENESLKYILIEEGLNLQTNLQKTFKILKKEGRNIYEFPPIKEIITY